MQDWHERVARLREQVQALAPISAGFFPPDAGAAYTPYACSYHWFVGPDGRAISIDVIRSHDSGQLGLRFVRETAAGIEGLAHIVPLAQWQPFATSGVLPTDPGDDPRPLLSRSTDSIAGQLPATDSARAGAPPALRFQLRLDVIEPGLGSGQLGLGIAHLVATDFLHVHYRGFVEIHGERLAIDAPGAISLHAGDRLPQYAYLLTLPRHPASGQGAAPPQILAAAIHDDALRTFGEHLGTRSLIYAHGRSGLPRFSLHVGDIDRTLPLGASGHIAIRALRPFLHDFLGQPTCTGIVEATFQPLCGDAIDLGTAYIDFRGEHFLRSLQRLLPDSAPAAWQHT